MVFCSVILHLALVTLIASQATSPDYCSVLCQGKKSSTSCQNLISQYRPKDKLSRLNFICCFTNEFIITHHNYFKDVTQEFKDAIIVETNQDILYHYAECVSKCAELGTPLSLLACEKHANNKYSECKRKTCPE